MMTIKYRLPRLVALNPFYQPCEHHSGVQEDVWWALRNVAANVDNQVSIAKAVGIEAIVSAMRAHSRHSGVQEQGCWVLGNLAWNIDSIKALIAEASGIEAIMSAMQGHWNHAGV